MSIHRHTGIQIQHTEGRKDSIHTHTVCDMSITHARARTHRIQRHQQWRWLRPGASCGTRGGEEVVSFLWFSILPNISPSFTQMCTRRDMAEAVVWRSLARSGLVDGGRREKRRKKGRRSVSDGCLILSLWGLFALVLTASAGRQNPLHKVFGPPGN